MKKMKFKLNLKQIRLIIFIIALIILAGGVGFWFGSHQLSLNWLKNQPQITIERQCDNEFLKELAEPVSKVEAVVSFGCGAGVQAIAERFPEKPVYPGLDTQFLGVLEEQAIWTEKCLGCGQCMLSQFGGICPVTRCAKRLLNGPCGGSAEDRCEVDSDKPCAWQLIYNRLKAIGQLDRLEDIIMPKDWSTAWYGGARKIVRKEHQV